MKDWGIAIFILSLFFIIFALRMTVWKDDDNIDWENHNCIPQEWEFIDGGNMTSNNDTLIVHWEEIHY